QVWPSSIAVVHPSMRTPSSRRWKYATSKPERASRCSHAAVGGGATKGMVFTLPRQRHGNPESGIEGFRRDARDRLPAFRTALVGTPYRGELEEWLRSLSGLASSPAASLCFLTSSG